MPKNQLTLQAKRIVLGFLASLLFIALICVQSTYSAESNYLWKSPDSVDTTNHLQGLHYGGGEWLALGESNTIVTSSDGREWDLYNPDGAYGEWNDAYYDGNQWFLVGRGGKIYSSQGSSPSTSSWTEIPHTTSVDNLLAITQGFGKYFIVGNSGKVIYSSNKTTWDIEDDIVSIGRENMYNLRDIILAEGIMVIVSDSGSIYGSLEGEEWTLMNGTTASTSYPLYGLAYGNGRFVAVGDKRISYSDDGQDWKNVSVPGKSLFSVTYGNGKFVAVGSGGTILTSTDGQAWDTTESSGTIKHLIEAGYSSERQQFVIVGQDAIIKTQSHNNQLSGLSLSSGTLSPTFASGTTSYTANVANSVASIKVTPVKADTDASVQVRVNGGTFTPVTGASSGDLNLIAGTNTVEVQVTAQDGVASKTYTITVTRANPNAAPTSISITNSVIAENADPGTVIGTLNAVDPDSSVPFGFTLISGDTDSFVIDNSVLKSKNKFDYETKNTYSVTIRVTDSGGAYFDKSFDITVTNVNDLPVVSDFSKAGTEDIDVTFAASDFDSRYSDGDSDPLSNIQVTSLPANGTLKLGSSNVTVNQGISTNDLGQLRYVPSLNWNGTDSFTWKGHDGGAYSANAATVTLPIAAVNDAPTVSNRTVNGTEDTELVFSVNDFTSVYTDVEVTPLSKVQIVSLPDQGTLKLNGNEVTANQEIPTATLSTLSFVPPAKWDGTTTIVWKGSDGTDYSTGSATLTILIATVNDSPTVSDFIKSGTEDSDVTFTEVDFTSHYVDEEGNGLSKIQIVDLPDNGTLKLNGTAITTPLEIAANDLAQLRFAPDENWSEDTSFTWKGHDGTSYSASLATVFIEIASVDDAPKVNNSTKSGTEDTELAFTESDFTSAYTDAEGDPLKKVQITRLPDQQHGTLLFDGGVVDVNDDIWTAELSKLTFYPTPEWNGSTTFEWKGYDGNSYSAVPAVLTINIASVNDLPTSFNIQKSGEEDVGVFFTADDFVHAFDGKDGDSLSKVRIVSLPASGVLKLNGDEVAANDEISKEKLSTLRFVPDKDWSGTISFQWKGNDGTDYSTDSALVNITITPVDDEPVVFGITDQTINEDEVSGTISFTISDAETAVEDLTVTAISENESLIPVTNLVLGGSGASRTIHITPLSNKNGSATIAVLVNDGTNTTYQPFEVTVVPVNDAPVATNGSLSVTENQPKQGTLGASDVDGDSLTYTIVQQGAKGNVTINTSTGAYTYTPSPGAKGSDSFTFTVSDGTSDSNTATVTITITSLPPPPPPAALPPTISDIGNQTIKEDESTTDIAFSVADPDTNARSLVVQVSSNNQTLVPNDRIQLVGNDTNRTVRVMPAENQNGSAIITVTVSDGRLSASDTFMITVVAVNDPPVASNGTLVAKSDGVTTGTLVGSDVDGTPLTYVLVSQASKGKVVITHATKGEFTYTPNKGETGVDSFTFTVSDGTANSNVATVSITRQGSNNADLRGLKVSSGKLKPSFSAKRTNYTMEVENKVDSIKLTPTTADKEATVKINGLSVISGQPSEPIVLLVGANKVEVVVTAQDGTEKIYTITVERTYEPITEIVLNKKQLSLTVGDEPVTLEATVKPNQETDSLLVWTSSSPDVATVDQNGKVVPLAKGTTEITVSSPDGTVSDRCIVEVKEGKVIELIAEPVMLVLQSDESKQVQVSAYFGNESRREVTGDVVWTTKDKKVATVSKGKIQAIGKGTTLITASYKGKKAYILVKVYDNMWVDERDVEVTVTPTGSSSNYNLKVEGNILVDDDLSVNIAFEKALYQAKVDKEKQTFTFERKIKINKNTVKEIQLQIKPKGSDEEEQLITLPIALFDPDSINVKENRKDTFTITGDVYNPMVISKIEAVVDGEVITIGSLRNNQFELKLTKWKGDKLIVRATAYNGFVQEVEVEIE